MKKLNEDPSRKHSEIVNNIIESLKKQELQPNSTAKKLSTNAVRNRQFHILPQIHKPKFQGDQSLAQLTAILARFPSLSTTTLNHMEKHYHLIPKTKRILSIKSMMQKTTCYLRCKILIHEYSKP